MTGPCPRETVWAEIAAGAVTADMAMPMLSHAAECRTCSVLLREAIAILNPDGPEFADTSPSKRLPSPPRRQRWRMFLAVAASVLGVTIGATFLWHSEYHRDPVRLLAMSYSAQRPFLLRIPEAHHGEIRARRGVPSLADVPATLIESEMLVRRAMERGDQAPVWLHARGLAELLRGQVRAATQSLELAAARDPNNAAILIDLASAYAQRGEENHTEADFTKSTELLTQALRLRPNDPAALFNRGVLWLRLELLDAAIRDLQACLRLESDPAWRKEAEQQLAIAQQRHGMLKQPEGYPRTAELGLDQILRSGTLVAVSQLPDVRPVLTELAQSFLKTHDDHWIPDMVALSQAPWRSVISQLASLASARTSMTPELYKALPNEFVTLETATLPRPLALWRDFEFLFRASHSRTLNGCSTDDLAVRAKAARYRWLAIQSLLELATCANAKGLLWTGAQLTEKALALAKGDHFQLLEIRAEGFRTSRFVYEGRYSEAISLSVNSLRRILDSGLPVYRAQQFYNDIMRSSEALKRVNVAYAAAEMSALSSERAGYSMLEVLARVSMANFAERKGDREAAQRSYRRAIELGRSLEHDDNAAAYIHYARAALLEAQGDLAAFRSLENSLGTSANLMLAVPYWARRASLELHTGEPVLAGEDAQRAIHLLRKALPGRDPRLFRLMNEQASQTLVEALLLKGQHEPALRAWEDYLKSDWLLIKDRQVDVLAAPLPVGAIRITPAALGNRLAVWSERNGNVQFYWSSLNLQEIRMRLNALRLLLASPDSPASLPEKEADALLSAIVPPSAQPSLQGAPCIWQARGEFAGFPLALLSARTHAWAVYAPGPPEVAVPTGNPVFDVVAAEGSVHEIPGRELGPLPGIEEEVESAVFGWRSTRTLRGRDATPEAILASAASGRVFHFAGHAVPWQGTVALVAFPDTNAQDESARQGLLVLRPALRMRLQLAVLSACSTASIGEEDSVQPSRFAEAALAAGIQQVVASLWDVDSLAATQFSKDFYAALRTRRTPAESLHIAVEGLRSNSRFAHPYYWAPFVIYAQTL